MTGHKTGTREEWLAARLELLEAEKELTRRSDEVARQRRELPWVRVDKDYRFETDGGTASLAACSGAARSCSSTTSCSGPTTPPDARPARRSPTGSTGPPSTSPTTTSRSARCRGRRWRKCRPTSGGWGGASVGVRLRQRLQIRLRGGAYQGGVGSGHRRVQLRRGGPAAGGGQEDALDAFSQSIVGTDWQTYRREGPGMSAFALQDGTVYHAYSTYARGLDGLWGMYQWLDRAPLGRNENGFWWWRRHDEYDSQ